MVAFQYQGEILYRCCRAIHPGQELLLSYEEEQAEDLSDAFGGLSNRASTDDGTIFKQGWGWGWLGGGFFIRAFF